jgi:hypothetical protein
MNLYNTGLNTLVTTSIAGKPYYLTKALPLKAGKPFPIKLNPNSNIPVADQLVAPDTVYMKYGDGIISAQKREAQREERRINIGSTPNPVNPNLHQVNLKGQFPAQEFYPKAPNPFPEVAPPTSPIIRKRRVVVHTGESEAKPMEDVVQPMVGVENTGIVSKTSKANKKKKASTKTTLKSVSDKLVKPKKQPILREPKITLKVLPQAKPVVNDIPNKVVPKRKGSVLVNPKQKIAKITKTIQPKQAKAPLTKNVVKPKATKRIPKRSAVTAELPERSVFSKKKQKKPPVKKGSKRSAVTAELPKGSPIPKKKAFTMKAIDF